MKPNTKFLNFPKSFWASVRSVSQKVGYTIKGEGKVKAPTYLEIEDAFIKLNLKPEKILKANKPTALAKNLVAYYECRATLLNNFVEPRLMDEVKVKSIYNYLI